MDIQRGPVEVALSTDLRGAPYSFALWDIHTGAQLVVFKGNKSSPINNCLQLIDSNYFITATDNILQVWSIYNRKCQDQKLFLPGRPSSLCVSPCGRYLIVGISDMIYIWQFNSGNLLAHTQRHYQTVTVMRMNFRGTFLISGAEDGMVLVWPFADLISGTHNTGPLGQSKMRTDIGINEPRFTWQHHSASITDIHISVSDCDLCITASMDKTINIYSYLEGDRLKCITDWPTPIWSVVMDKNCNRLYLGGQDGSIYEVATSLMGSALIDTREESGSGSRQPILKGHKDRINRLMLSIDGSMLISGSIDSTCKVWDIPSGKMIRDVKHQAPLANLVSLLIPDSFSLTSMTQSQIKPPFLLKPLKRNLYKMPRDATLMKAELFEESSTSIIMKKRATSTKHRLQQIGNQMVTKTRVARTDISQSDDPKNDKPDTNRNARNDDDIRSRLRELYLLASEKLFKDAASEALKPYEEMVSDTNVKQRKKTKRKDTVSDNKQVSPKTNGIKRVKKSPDDIFV